MGFNDHHHHSFQSFLSTILCQLHETCIVISIHSRSNPQIGYTCSDLPTTTQFTHELTSG